MTGMVKGRVLINLRGVPSLPAISHIILVIMFCAWMKQYCETDMPYEGYNL
jgi:hypothetical protein